MRHLSSLIIQICFTITSALLSGRIFWPISVKIWHNFCRCSTLFFSKTKNSFDILVTNFSQIFAMVAVKTHACFREFKHTSHKFSANFSELKVGLPLKLCFKNGSVTCKNQGLRITDYFTCSHAFPLKHVNF